MEKMRITILKALIFNATAVFVSAYLALLVSWASVKGKLPLNWNLLIGAFPMLAYGCMGIFIFYVWSSYRVLFPNIRKWTNYIAIFLIAVFSAFLNPILFMSSSYIPFLSAGLAASMVYSLFFYFLSRKYDLGSVAIAAQEKIHA